MTHSDDGAAREDARARLQKYLTELGDGDDCPVVLTAYQASKVAAILGQALKDHPDWLPHARAATGFLEALSVEAKGVEIHPSAADLWLSLAALPWPIRD